MKYNRGFFFFVVAIAAPILCPAQTKEKADYFVEQRLRYENFVYTNNIKSVFLNREGNELSTPAIQLNSGEQLRLSFDDLNGGEATYSYTFIHCTADWTPTDINQNEYLPGFLEDRIFSVSYSFNTNQRYSHYNVLFPNENLNLTKTGNYIIKVFSDYDQNKVVLTRRFMIYQSKIKILPNIRRASGGDDQRTKQEVDFTIDLETYPVENPFSDLKIIITQNDRWDNAVGGLQPRFVKDKELIYDNEDVNIFNGGSEFRSFDFRSVKYVTEHISSYSYEPAPKTTLVYDTTVQKFIHVHLLSEDKRSSMRYYTSQGDINGKYYLSASDGKNSETEGEYAFVHFHLPYSEPVKDGNIYVGGALTEWTFNNDNKMIYNAEEQEYQCTLFLKQGFYNFEYFFLADGSNKADETQLEGNHAETENEYAIYVYHRAFASRYDELIGVKFVNSTSPR